MPPKLRAAMSLLAVSAMTAALALGPGVQAQSPTPGPFCELITADEASTALGVAVAPTDGTDFTCTYTSDMESTFVTLVTRVYGGTLQSIKDGWPDGEGLTIGGKPAWYVEDLLWTEIGGRLLQLTLVSFEAAGPDHKTALTALMEIGVGRWDSLSIPVETPVPQPSFVGDQELVGLFPKEIGGQAVQVISFTGQELLANLSGEEAQAAVKQITDALTPLGKTIDDVSLGYTLVVNGASGALLVAVRVRGADATALEPLVLPLLKGAFLTSISDPQETPSQVAGRDVTMITDGPPSDTGNKAYLYPKNDIVWLVAVSGTGIAVEDVLNTLP